MIKSLLNPFNLGWRKKSLLNPFILQNGKNSLKRGKKIMIIDKILEVLEMLIDGIAEVLKLFLELNFNCIKLIIFNSLCRLVFIGFVCLWLIIIIIANKEDVKEYISIYLTDIRIYKEELKQYDDITFKLFGRNKDGYTLKDFLPVTKERIEYYKAVKEYEGINID